jgi:hypothetical protein
LLIVAGRNVVVPGERPRSEAAVDYLAALSDAFGGIDGERPIASTIAIRTVAAQ